MDGIKIFTKFNKLRTDFRKTEAILKKELGEEFGLIGCRYAEVSVEYKRGHVFVIISHDVFTATDVKNMSEIMRKFGFIEYDFNNENNTVNVTFILTR